jgi:hypothetical protein
VLEFGDAFSSPDSVAETVLIASLNFSMRPLSWVGSDSVVGEIPLFIFGYVYLVSSYVKTKRMMQRPKKRAHHHQTHLQP